MENQKSSPPLNIVLVEPEIPQNTGNIGRLCVATQSHLHLVEPLGFEITDSQLKRAGLDYWQYLSLTVHANLEVFLKSVPSDRSIFFFSKKAGTSHWDHQYPPGSYLVFGKETAGLPEDLMNRFPLQCARIPLYDARVRSLNLSNAVGVVVYEALRQINHSILHHPVHQEPKQYPEAPRPSQSPPS